MTETGTTPCQHPTCRRSDRYDAYYCTACHEWTETTCSDADCSFCAGRPETACDVPDRVNSASTPPDA